MKELMKTYRFSPWTRGNGATFTLRTYDTGRRAADGKNIVAYDLTRSEGGKRTMLFSGADFMVPPTEAIDSDSAAHSLMAFLTLRPEDTDAEYFSGYTKMQREWVETSEPEDLMAHVSDRFGQRY